MEIRNGLISADSHVVAEKSAFVERLLNGVPEDERKKMLYFNAQSLYGLC